MQHKPQRPFVPHRTPKAAPQTVTHSEFRLPRPFVAGSPREEIEREQLPRINEFLDTSPPYRAPASNAAADEYAADLPAESYEAPPLEHFLDPLPAVGAFAPDTEGALLDESATREDFAAAVAASPTPTETGWLVEGWQHYDWRAAAALGEGVEAAASSEWATTDWDMRSPEKRDARPSAAHAIANALDQIAQRIREGQLTVPPAGGIADPAAIAANLAALLGIKR